MAPLSVHIKHAGKTYDVQLDPDLPPSVFKDSVYQLTGVPTDRMKVMVKGGVLKDDDSAWKKIAPKAGQTFMVIGAAGELPKPPSQPIVFLEDMDDSELAEALASPAGLTNLGNTCYLNASIQALRAIPELQIALNNSTTASTALPRELHSLFTALAKTTGSITPNEFLQTLRQVNPQFAETNRNNKTGGLMNIMSSYAQQDAEECYAQIVTTLRDIPGLPPPSSSSTSTSAPTPQQGGESAATVDPGPGEVVTGTGRVKKFVEQFMMGQMRRELTCDEAPEEPPSVTTEEVLKMECNISAATSFMVTAIQKSLDQKVEKTSPTLGRQAVYTQKSRLTRLPAYLTTHMVRFEWRGDIGKKAKVMRKVKFPLELDALDWVTDELRAKLLPVSRRLKEVEKERQERTKVRKRTKGVVGAGAAETAKKAVGAAEAGTGTSDVEMGDVNSAIATATTTGQGSGGEGDEKGKVKDKAEGGELEDESVYREKELRELESLVNEDLKKDYGCSVSGFYDLVAIVTHKGAAADAGHYMGFVKKSVFHPVKGRQNGIVGTEAYASGAGGSGTTSSKTMIAEDDEDWYKFDDAKVSLFPVEKLGTLDGGGEDSSAYVLLYKSKSFA